MSYTYFRMTKQVEYEAEMEVKLPFGWVEDDIDNWMEMEWFPSMGDCVVVELCSLMVARTFADYKKDEPKTTTWETMFADEALMVEGKLDSNGNPRYRLVIPMQSDWEENFVNEDIEVEIG